MTTATAPSGPPGPITLDTVTPNSAIVQWGEVPCPQRNGLITGYTVTATNSGGMGEGTASFDVDARRATISGLTPSTQYTVSVAAVNSAGTGPSTTLSVETPDGLTVSATPSSSTSLAISWALEDSLTATSYTISYSNTNTDCFTNSRSGIPASGTSYTLDGLEEGTEYSITVTATLTGNGGTQEGSTTATTLTAAPSALPSSVRVLVNSSTSIIVQWGPVECRHQNGEITGYWVRYGEEGSSEEARNVQMVSGDSSGGMTTVSGLTRETVYTVQVTAVTSSGTGVYSDPLIIKTPDDVFLSLNGSIIPNNGYVDISDIGSTDNTALLCITNRPPMDANSRGNWFAPDETRVGGPGTTDVPGFTRNRDSMVVRLLRNTATDPAAEGIYQCLIDDAISRSKQISVGLYNSGGGDISIPGDVLVESDLNGASPQFTLTCISTGGPATTVTWTKDNVIITGEQNETVLNDPVTAQYTHTLTVTTAGVYTCTVANNKSSSDSASITLEGPPRPTDVTAVQDGPTSITVTWTPPSPLGDTTGYRISFTGGSDVDIDGGSTNSYTLTGLTNGQTYTISIVATSEHLFGDATTFEITLSKREIGPYISVIAYSSPSSRTGVCVSELHNSHLHLPLLECVQWEGGQLGGGLETH
ncbi:Receptor-type tyrosine-protein phosphatase delta [Geodia barretti]|uniref:Receptor-type tyrosine-protein phosphatase delta n=1 Tax=Geodia barretti TaxID=519541 RepID=A0AA35SRZ4_GEOBA|nr:Receptor-type tyrosine-protein phosphatase delta [Geodia barretti]